MRSRRPGLWSALVVAALLVAGVFFVIRTGSDERMTEARTLSVPETRVRVEVLNGGGVGGAARRATEFARAIGFDVVYFGNAASFDRVESEVVDRVGRPELAEAVAEALGIGNVRSEPDPDLYVDVSVVLGSRWEPPDGSSVPPGEP